MRSGTVRLSSIKKNPVRERPHGVWRESRTVTCVKTAQQIGKPCGQTRTEGLRISVTENMHRTMLPLPLILKRLLRSNSLATVSASNQSIALNTALAFLSQCHEPNRTDR